MKHSVGTFHVEHPVTNVPRGTSSREQADVSIHWSEKYASALALPWGTENPRTKSDHLPIQKRLKIDATISSCVICPVNSPTAVAAA